MRSYVADEVIAITRDADVTYVQSRARAFARDAGLDVQGQWAVAIAASELSTNVIKFGPPGTLTLRRSPGPPPSLIIEAADSGPGFDRLSRARAEGTSPDIEDASMLPHERRGLGHGLGAVRRLIGDLAIHARPGGGTIVVAKLRLRR